MDRRPPSTCLDEQTLAALISGGIAASRMPSIEAHVAQCADCRRVVADAAFGVHDASEPSETPEQNPPAPGDLLADKYRIESRLGRGGMGVVLTARHIELGHRVAIKVLHSNEKTAAARFLREAKACAHLVDDHIARVHDLGRLPNGVPYFVMEHLVGEDLGRRLAKGRVPLEDAMAYLLQTCAALRAAHAAGIIHRDLKPSNLFIVERTDGKPWLKVLDFGISKFTSGSQLAMTSTLTSPESLLGSPAYMSPEQIRSSKGVDVRSDVWSLGVIMHELLTGTRPFRATTLSALLAAIATETPALPSSIAPGLPASLDPVVLRCLEKHPDARYASMAALLQDLRRVKLRESGWARLARWVKTASQGAVR